jgi:hypothetical protein
MLIVNPKQSDLPLSQNCQGQRPSTQSTTLVTVPIVWIILSGILPLTFFFVRFTKKLNAMKKIKYLSSLMMKVPDHVYVLGYTYT